MSDTVEAGTQGFTTANLTSNAASTGNTAALAVSTAQNGGADTLVTLHDGSTIYLVGVNYSAVGPSFFS